jgi:hypothetical protein
MCKPSGKYHSSINSLQFMDLQRKKHELGWVKPMPMKKLSRCQGGAHWDMHAAAATSCHHL